MQEQPSDLLEVGAQTAQVSHDRALDDVFAQPLAHERDALRDGMCRESTKGQVASERVGRRATGQLRHAPQAAGQCDELRKRQRFDRELVPAPEPRLAGSRAERRRGGTRDEEAMAPVVDCQLEPPIPARHGLDLVEQHVEPLVHAKPGLDRTDDLARARSLRPALIGHVAVQDAARMDPALQQAVGDLPDEDGLPDMPRPHQGQGSSRPVFEQVPDAAIERPRSNWKRASLRAGSAQCGL